MAFGFSRGLAHFYGIILTMIFKFSRIFKTKLETSGEYRPSALGAEISCPVTGQQPAYNFFLNLLKIKSVTDHIQNILLSPASQWIARLQSESLCFNKIGVTYTIFYILKEADWMLLQASADLFCYMLTILLQISWKYKCWYIQKGLCDIVQSLDI